MNRPTAYPSIFSCIKQLVRYERKYPGQDNKYYQKKILYKLKHVEGNTWTHVSRKDKKIFFNNLQAYKEELCYYIKRGEQENWNKNIYHYLVKILSNKYFFNMKKMTQIISIISKYFNEDINHLDHHPFTPLEWYIYMCRHIDIIKNEQVVQVLYNHGAYITENIIERSKKYKYLYNYLEHIRQPEIKEPGYE